VKNSNYVALRGFSL